MRKVPAATTLLTVDQLGRVGMRSDLRGCFLVTHAWSVIAGASALFIVYPNVLTYVLAVLVIGSRQLGLLILMHDAAHNALFRTPMLMRRFLFENGDGELIETERGYLEVLRKVTLALPDDAGPRRGKRASGTFSDGFEAG